MPLRSRARWLMPVASVVIATLLAAEAGAATVTMPVKGTVQCAADRPVTGVWGPEHREGRRRGRWQ